MKYIVVTQCALVLVILFEPPGPFEDDRFKTISDGLKEHQGFALALFVSLVAAMDRIISIANFWPLTCFLAWSTLAGFLGMLYYPNNSATTNAHLMYASMALVSPVLVQTQLVIEGASHILAHTVFAWIALVAVAVSFSLWTAATGVLELVYLGALWSSWLCVII